MRRFIYGNFILIFLCLNVLCCILFLYKFEMCCFLIINGEYEDIYIRVRLVLYSILEV